MEYQYSKTYTTLYTVLSTENGNTHTHTHTHTYIYIYIYNASMALKHKCILLY